MRIFLGIAAAVLASAPVTAQSGEVDTQKLGQRAEAFVRVRNQFDHAAMIAMMAPNTRRCLRSARSIRESA
jgi:1,2-phenylacetyl-CoA epoxidase PaaB subunit